MEAYNSYHAPMESMLRLKKQDSSLVVDKPKYHIIVRNLCQLVNTRSDINHVIDIDSPYMEASNTQRWAAVKQILSMYMCGTLNFGCSYKSRGKVELVGYSDSDQGDDMKDWKSTSRIVYFTRRSLITWSSQKLKVVALSLGEAKYIVVATTSCQGFCLDNISMT